MARHRRVSVRTLWTQLIEMCPDAGIHGTEETIRYHHAFRVVLELAHELDADLALLMLDQALGYDGPAREEAAYSLSFFAEVDYEVVLPRFQRALNDQSASVRREAAMSLYELAKANSQAAIPFLKQALQDPEPQVRRNAAESLGGLDKVVEELEEIVRHDEDPEVRERAEQPLQRQS